MPWRNEISFPEKPEEFKEITLQDNKEGSFTGGR